MLPAVVVAALVLGGGVLASMFRQGARETAGSAVPVGPGAPAAPRQPTLYCEFYNFVGRKPKVGFYFTIAHEGVSPAYEQVFQREGDGAQTDFGTDGASRPEWAFDGSDSPATLRSPDQAIQINLYGYKPVAGTTWFEAGLRSVQYLNLDGKCRRSAA